MWGSSGDADDACSKINPLFRSLSRSFVPEGSTTYSVPRLESSLRKLGIGRPKGCVKLRQMDHEIILSFIGFEVITTITSMLIRLLLPYLIFGLRFPSSPRSRIRRSGTPMIQITRDSEEL